MIERVNKTMKENSPEAPKCWVVPSIYLCHIRQDLPHRVTMLFFLVLHQHYLGLHEHHEQAHDHVEKNCIVAKNSSDKGKCSHFKVDKESEERQVCT